MKNKLFGIISFSFIFLSLAGAYSAHSQTLFYERDTAPDYSKYVHVEECYIAIRRIADSVKNSSPVWQDTVAYERKSLFAENPASAIRAGVECVSKMPADSVNEADAKNWGEVFLMASLDEKVDSVYTRIYAAAMELPPPGKDSLLMHTFSEHLNLLRTARPLRYDRIKDLYHLARTQIEPDSVILRLLLAGLVRTVAADVGDTAFALTAAQEVLLLNDSLPESQRNNPMYRGVLIHALFDSKKAVLADSLMHLLAVDTDAYVRLLKEAFIFAAGDEGLFPMLNGPLGEVAPSLEAQHWFQSMGNNGEAGNYEGIGPVARPLKGKINLVVFLHGGCHDMAITIQHGRPNPSINCWPMLSTLRRLKADFPDLEITGLVNTHGNIGKAPPIEPAAEADTLADYFLGFHRMPAVLAVNEREFFNLPGLDRRRIDTESENEVNYQAAGLGQVIGVGGAIILDEDGKIVHVVQNFLREAQLDVRKYLEILSGRRNSPEY